VIRVAFSPSGLAPIERFGLDVLVDQSRLLRIADDADIPDAVHVTASDAEAESAPVAPRLAHRAWDVAAGEGAVRVPRSVLREVGELAGAVAEQRSRDADRHGRVPSSVNALVAQGGERSPLVNDTARRLREAAVAAAGRRPMWLVAPWPNGRRWAAALTHDIDAVSWWPLFTLLRVAELARKSRWGLARRSLAAATSASLTDPVTAAVAHILAVERRHGVRATWFALCGTPTLGTMARGDLTYRPESGRARRILRRLVAEGHEVGLHGSFATWLEPAAMGNQRRRLEGLCGAPVSGVRQHYLRMRPGQTQRVMSEAGFRYDATFGFPDRNGFRLGTADVVPAWDDARAAVADLSEVPLTWMDRAMSKYSGVESPAAWVDDALELARSCRDVEGLWVGLWHPNLTDALGYPGAPVEFERLVSALAADEPHFDTVSSLVEWRRRRRSLRVRRVRADGGVELQLEGAPAFQAGLAGLALEAPRG
jgi:hypothetical protein